MRIVLKQHPVNHFYYPANEKRDSSGGRYVCSDFIRAVFGLYPPNVVTLCMVKRNPKKSGYKKIRIVIDERRDCWFLVNKARINLDMYQRNIINEMFDYPTELWVKVEAH